MKAILLSLCLLSTSLQAQTLNQSATIADWQRHKSARPPERFLNEGSGILIVQYGPPEQVQAICESWGVTKPFVIGCAHATKNIVMLPNPCLWSWLRRDEFAAIFCHEIGHKVAQIEYKENWEH